MRFVFEDNSKCFPNSVAKVRIIHGTENFSFLKFSKDFFAYSLHREKFVTKTSR